MSKINLITYFVSDIVCHLPVLSQCYYYIEKSAKIWKFVHEDYQTNFFYINIKKVFGTISRSTISLLLPAFCRSAYLYYVKAHYLDVTISLASIPTTCSR